MDSSSVSSLTITIDREPAGSEVILPSAVGVTVDSTMNSVGRVITYAGVQPIATYVDILRSIQYINNEDEPVPELVRLVVQVFTQSATSGSPLASNVVEATIEINPRNDNDPVFSRASYSGEVYENASNGSAVLTVMASDEDIYSGASITYQIAEESDEFYIDGTLGNIVTTRPLDAEATLLYDLTVIASDNDGIPPRSSNVTVTISILDLNDNPPVFTNSEYLANLTENAEDGQSVLTVTATDSDITPENSNVTYELQTTSDEGSGSGGLTPLPPQQEVLIPFTVDPRTGELRVGVGAVIDYETVTEYSLQVEATDGEFSTSVEIIILVLDKNDEKPQFTRSLYIGSVAEDAALGTVILTVLATDGDSTAITYTIEGSEHLDVDSVTGAVTLSRTVDFSVMPELTAVVIANDTGSPPLISRANVSIEVVNINNNAPIFSEDGYTFTVIEGMSLLGRVIATDADGDSIAYLTLEGFEDKFALNSTSGIIVTLPGFELDYETLQVHIVRVAATDGTFSTAVTVTIEVEDANDNAPTFSSAEYSATLPESSAPGTSVVQVEAEDRDSGSNAVIVYSIIPGGDLFRIGRETGIIRLERRVDFEADRGPFVLTVVAMNTEPPHWNDSTVVTVAVSDSNDNHPILSLDTLDYSYVENSPPLPIASNLRITDEDTHIHLLSQCEVTLERGPCRLSSSELSNVCGSIDTECESVCAEEIAINISLANASLVESPTVIDTTSQLLVVSGNASEADYQAVLSSLTYFNRAAEPSPGTRTVSMQCQDAGRLASNILLLSVNVVLTNDNPLMIEAEPQRLNFIEGAATLTVGETVGLRLIDLDVDSGITWVEVSLENPRDSVRESVSVDSVSVSGGGVESGLSILINQTSSLQNYQVCL